jgi:hypothetical protein
MRRGRVEGILPSRVEGVPPCRSAGVPPLRGEGVPTLSCRGRPARVLCLPCTLPFPAKRQSSYPVNIYPMR